MLKLLIDDLIAIPKSKLPKKPLPRNRIEDLAAAKAQWLKDIHIILTEPMTSSQISEKWGVSRMTTFHRLAKMEKEGIVERFGEGRFTKWRLKND